MWPRLIEMLLAIWLFTSPFLFGHYPADDALWINDLVAAAMMFLLAAGSLWRKLRYAHLGNLVVALWLILFAYFEGGYPAAPGYQNEIIVGLILIFFAIIPNQATEPPESWRTFYELQRPGNEGPGETN